MRTAMLGLLAETPVHPGAGRGMGVVDLPVAREAATDYPVIVGSSLKGALRDKAATIDADADRHFGKPDHAGDLLVADGRLLLLPVRSLTGAFRWVTCSHLIERYCRDLARAGLTPRPKVPDCRARFRPRGWRWTVCFSRSGSSRFDGKPDGGLVKSISPLVLHEETQRRLDTRIAVLDDDDFAWFVRYGLSIQARNVLA